MPKQKTNKSAKKRVRVTATGKILRNKCGKRHLLSNKTGKRKRQLRGTVTVTGKVAAKYVAALAPGL